MADPAAGVSTPGKEEGASLLDVIVKALEPYDIPTGAWSPAERIEPARSVLAALNKWLTEDANRRHQDRYGPDHPEHMEIHSCPCWHEAAYALADSGGSV